MSGLAWAVLMAAVPVSPATPQPTDAIVTVRCHGARHDTTATGFLVAPGVVATALHAVTGRSPDDVPLRVDVVAADGSIHSVRGVLASDPSRDVGLLRVEIDGAPWLEMGGPAAAGSVVHVISRARRSRTSEMSTPIASVFLDLHGRPRYRVTLPMRSRSGAPALDATGAVVGIVSMTHELIPVEAIRDLMAHPGPATLADAHRSLMATPWGMLEAASHARGHGASRAAMDFLRRAAETDPPLAAVHVQIAELLADWNHPVEALEELRSAERAGGLDPFTSARARRLKARLEPGDSNGPGHVAARSRESGGRALRFVRAPCIAIGKPPEAERTYVLSWLWIVGLPGWLVSRWRTRKWMSALADDAPQPVAQRTSARRHLASSQRKT